MKNKFVFSMLFILPLLIMVGCDKNPDDGGKSDGEQTHPPADTTQSQYPQITSYIYDLAALPVITLEISTAEWNNLLSYYDQNEHNEENIHADIRFQKGADIYDLQDIGVRLRGNTSRRRPEGNKGQQHNASNPDWHHASFSLNFKKFVKGQTLVDNEKLNLKWFKDDALYVRELYCYELFRRFGVWTAPMSSYCRLYIKIKEDAASAYYGVYEMVEPIDKEYVKRRLQDGMYPDKDGNLWKASYGADFASSDRSQMGLEDITLEHTVTPVYDLKTNEESLESAKDELVDFILKLNGKTGESFKNWIETKMDVPLFLKTYAVNVLCGMWDDYWQNKNNFYFYFADDSKGGNSSGGDGYGKFYFIPYDYDNTLGTSFLVDNSGTQDLLNWGNSAHPLVKKIIAIPEYRALYISYLHELCNPENNYFYVDKSIQRISLWHALISPYISNDTEEDMVIEDVPALWGNCGFYRLLERNASTNYFMVRAAHLPAK
ncbi:MAG: CotH kinase family protein [Bacteroidales bacterium]|jgi:spore coat protein CotH|nr:CotH kinase family protein [Bacteroidales bacterium]